MAGNANSGRRAKPIIDPMTGIELPAGAVLPHRNSVVVDASLDRLNELQANIAKFLPGEAGEVIDLLAWAAVHFDELAALREEVSLERRGRKPYIDRQWLLIECAQIYAQQHGEEPLKILESLQVRVEDRVPDLDWNNPVIRWAGIVIKALGSEDEICRRQVDGAIARYIANIS